MLKEIITSFSLDPDTRISLAYLRIIAKTSEAGAYLVRGE